MVESTPPAGGPGGPARDDRGDAPAGPSPDQAWSRPSAAPAPLPVGDWRTPDPYVPRGPGFEAQPGHWPPPLPGAQPQQPTPYPPPPGFPPGRPPGAASALTPPGASPRRSTGAGLLALAAATALVVGGAAGYGGTLLAGRTTTTPTSSGPLPAATPPSTDPPTSSAPLPPAPAQANTVEIAKRVLPGTVMIQVGRATGSGFLLDTSGRIMTNNHVVAGAAGGGRIRVVLADGRRLTASLLGRSPSYDLAVIKIKPSGQLRPLPSGNSDASQVGQPVIAVGAPLGLPGTVTQGIVSARDRPVVVNEDANADAPTAYINAIQTDAPINPGNSGGPLIDAAGRVIGVNSAILTLGSGAGGQTGNIGLGFAIPINQARQIGAQLIKNGKARYPVIGATVSDERSAGGVEIATVEGGGPAASAGLRVADVVTKIDGKTVTTMEELIVAIRTHRPGDQVVLDYSRGSAERTARVTLGSKEG